MKKIFGAMAVATGLVGLQLILALAAGSNGEALQNWRGLYRWDGVWYAGVCDSGYEVPRPQTAEQPGNVAFFPGYPLLARAVGRATGFSTPDALLLSAQIAAWGFWTYFLLILSEWNVPRFTRAAVALTLACHPAGFFLIASYSESLFLFALFGFVYWSDRPGRIAAVLAIAHGFAMTSTRLVGIAAAAYPLLKLGSIRGLPRAALLALGACAGTVAYYAYVQIAFGSWGAISEAHAVGWNVHPDPFAPFRARAWGLDYARFARCWSDPESLSRMIYPVSVLQFVGLGILEVAAARSATSNWRRRWPLYIIALVAFLLPVISHGSRGMSSLFRFALVWTAILALAAAGLLADHPRLRSAWGYLFLGSNAAIWVSLQWRMLALYQSGIFVA